MPGSRTLLPDARAAKYVELIASFLSLWCQIRQLESFWLMLKNSHFVEL
jgi:hypothetical protein